MKVLHIVCTAPPYKGGMGNSALRMCQDVSGYVEVKLVTTDYGGRIIDRDNGIVYLPPLIKYGNAAVLPSLISEIRQSDIVHLHYPFFGNHLLVLFAVLFYRKKFVLHYHMNVRVGGLLGVIVNFNKLVVEPLLVLAAHRIIVSSYDYLQESSLKSTYRQNPEKFFELPFGIDTNKHQPTSRQKKHSFLFVGGLDDAHYFKGVDNLIKAMAVLMKEDNLSDWYLDIIGSGSRMIFLQKLVVELGLTGRVNFLSRVDDNGLIVAYQDSGALILPSINQGEAFGLVLIEAMSCGTPVIASNLPGVRTVFDNGEQGELVEADNIIALSRGMQKIIVDANYRETAGQKARSLVLERYDRKIIANKLIQLYKSI